MDEDLLNPPKAQNYSAEAYDRAALDLLESGALKPKAGAAISTPIRFGSDATRARDMPHQQEEQPNPAEDMLPLGPGGMFVPVPHTAARAVQSATRVVGSAIGRATNSLADNVVSLGAGIVATGAKAANTLRPGFGDNIVGQDFINWYHARQQDRDEMAIRIVPKRDLEALAPQGVAENLASGVVQFALPFVATGGLSVASEGATLAETAHAAKAVSWAGLGTRVGINGLRALITDVGFFDAYDHRLSNLVEDYPTLSNPITRFLQAKPDDTHAEALLKQGLESVLLGNAVDVALEGLRFYRGAKSAARAGATDAAVGNAMADLDRLGSALEDQTTNSPVLAQTAPNGKGVVVPNQGWFQSMFGATRSLREQVANTLAPEQARVFETERRVARVDTRTGLGSRLSFDQTRAALDADPNTHWASLDLKGMKSLNDAVSPDAADRLISKVGQIARQTAEELGIPSDRLFSPKGDEFLAAAHSETQAREFNRLMSERVPKEWEGQPTGIRGGIGADVAAADQALNEAKILEKIPEPILMDTPMQAQRAAEVLNDAARVSELPRGAELSTEQVTAIKDLANKLPSTNNVDEAIGLLHGTDFNFNYFQSPVEARAQLEAMANVLAESMAEARQLGQPWEVTRKIGEDLVSGMNGNEFVQNLRELRGTTKNLASYAYVARAYLNGAARRVAKLSAIADADARNTIAFEQLAQGMQHLFDAAHSTLGLSSDIARALNIHKAAVSGEEATVEGMLRGMDDPLEHANGASQAAEDSQNAAAQGLEQPNGAAKATDKQLLASVPKPINPDKELLASVPKPINPDKELLASVPNPRGPQYPWVVEGMTDKQIRGLARQIRMSDGDPKSILSLMEASQLIAAKKTNPQMIEKLIRYRMEAMLSGPKTFLINSISNASVALYRPMEYWWSGLRSGNSGLRQQGADLFLGNFLELREAWKSAKRSFDAGKNFLDSEGIIDTQQILHPDKTGKAWLQKLFSAPSRYLMTADEFFKNLNYRSYVRSSSLRRSAEAGITGAEDVASRLSEDMEAAFNPFQQGRAVDQQALEYAKYNTFQNTLEPGSIGATLQDSANKHPFFRLILPFVKTPVNLFKFWVARTPGLNRFLDSHLADLAAGGERAALAQSRTEMGLAAYSLAGSLAFSGSITGRGPSDPDLRKQWRAAGWQPYSFKVPGTDRWISYRRGDPLSTTLGMVADLVQISGDLKDTDLEDLGYATIASITANLSSKTFYQGMVDAMDAFSSGETSSVEKFAQGFVGSFIPNLLTQINPDATVREANNLLETLMSRVPGFSQQLEPYRNIFGEKILRAPGYFNRSFNPFTTMNAPSSEDVGAQLVELGKSMSMPQPSVADGKIDLRDKSWGTTGQSPYDRWQQLVSEGGLRERLDKLMHSEAWQNASSGDNTYAPGGKRFLMAARVIKKYQDRAKMLMYREYPKLRTAVQQVDQLEAMSIRRGPEAVEDFINQATQ